MRTRSALAAVLALIGASAQSQPKSARAILFTGGTVIDCTGAPAHPNWSVLVQDGKIAAVGPAEKVTAPKDCQLIDAKGRWILPGLWDMHGHPDDPEIYPLNPKESDKDRMLPLFLINGVTTVRDMGGDLELLKRWRAKVDQGKLLGPRLYFGGPLVDGPKPMWPGSIAVGTPEEGRAAVRKLKREGAGFVKVYSLLPKDAYLAICDEAKKQGLPVAGHVPDSVTVSEAITAGQICQEHLLGFTRELCDRDAARRSAAELPSGTTRFQRRAAILKVYRDTYDGAKAASLYRRFVESGIWHTPTLLVGRRQARFKPDDPVIAPWLPFTPSYLQRHWSPEHNLHLGERAGDDGEGDRINEQLVFRMVREMSAAGVKLMAGSDCGGNPHMVPGFSLHEELAILVEAGLTPMQALLTATRNPSEFMGKLTTDGTLEVGKRADLILIDGDPLADIANTRRVSSVVMNGRYYFKRELDEIKESLSWQGAPGPVTARLRTEAAALSPMAISNLAKDFLAAVEELPEPKVRFVYRQQKGDKKFIPARHFILMSKEDRFEIDRVEYPASFYYDTKYGSPLAYLRAVEILGNAGFSSFKAAKIADFGYGGIGPLRLAASLGAEAIGVDVDPLLKAYYSEPLDTGEVQGSGKAKGRLRLIEGRFPADEPVAKAVGSGLDLFISKNTLKRGYIHPERQADPRALIQLGVSDEAFLASVCKALNPGGWFLIYNLAPAPSPADKPYKPWADGRCPFARREIESAGFDVIAFDVKDDSAARTMGRALGWDKGQGAMDLEGDLFATYTLARKR